MSIIDQDFVDKIKLKEETKIARQFPWAIIRKLFNNNKGRSKK